MLRATILADVPTPFQNAFFDSIAELGEVDIEVWFCRPSVPIRIATGGPRRARFRTLVGVGTGEFMFNPTLVPQLLRGAHGVTFVIGYYLPGLAAACLALGCLSRPWVFWTDTLPADSQAPWLLRLARNGLLRWCLDRSTLCLSTGETGRRSLLDLGVASERAFALPFVVDQKRFSQVAGPARERREQLRVGLAIEPKERVALFVGQMVDRKGVDILLRAQATAIAERGVDLRLLLVGSGPELENYKRLAASLGLERRATFLPPVSNERLPELFAVADALVLPSRFDPWPVVVIEALSSSLPVIASDACGSARDAIVSGVNGWLVRAGDSPALVEGLETLCRVSPEQLSLMGAAARERVACWSPEIVARDFTHVVEAALALQSRRNS